MIATHRAKSYAEPSQTPMMELFAKMVGDQIFHKTVNFYQRAFHKDPWRIELLQTILTHTHTQARRHARTQARTHAHTQRVTSCKKLPFSELHFPVI